MLKPEEIAEQFTERMQTFFLDTHDWRAESAKMEQFYAGHPTLGNQQNTQWQRLNNNPQPVKKRSYANAPIAPALIKHVVGMMSQSEKQFTAYNVNSSLDPDANTMRKGLQYIDSVTHRQSVKKEQIGRAAITGVGATVSSLDFTFDDSPEGLPSYELKRDIMFDTGLRGCLDSDRIAWCGYADPMKASALTKYIEDMDKRIDYPVAADFRHFLLEYDNAANQADIDFLYVYYWQEMRKVWDIENIFAKHNEEIVRYGEKYPAVYNLLGEIAGELQLDLNESHFIMDGEGRKKFYDALDNITFMTGGSLKFDLEESSRMGKAYYRAEFGQGKLLQASRSFTQSCHAMSFLTCEYDSSLGYHYGLLRPLAFYQVMLNQSIDDMLLYSGRAARGGTKIVKGAGVDAEKFKLYNDNGEEIFFGSKELEVSNVGTPDAAQSHLQTAELIMRMMPMSLGFAANWFDQMNQVEKTATEVKHIQAMMAMSLASFQGSLDKSTLCDGWIFRDMIYEMARNLAETKQITFTLGGKEDAIRLSKRNLSRNYAIRVIERKATRDEEMEEFNNFMTLLTSLVQDPQVLLRVAPQAIEISYLSDENKKKLLEALTPGQPTPQQQAMEAAQLEQQQANTRMINAQAAQLEQQSLRERSASDLNTRKAVVEIDKAAADIDLKQAQKTKTEADAAKVIADIGMAAIRGVQGAEQRI